MLEELQRLRESIVLQQLLEHYASLGTADRAVWQQRRMELQGVGAPEITALHGELLAFSWIEMNFGFLTGNEAGGLSACYRITLDGLRAWKRAQEGFLALEEEPAQRRENKDTARAA